MARAAVAGHRLGSDRRCGRRRTGMKPAQESRLFRNELRMYMVHLACNGFAHRFGVSSVETIALQLQEPARGTVSFGRILGESRDGGEQFPAVNSKRTSLIRTAGR